MLTLNNRPVRLPDGKIIHRNITSSDGKNFWVQYKKYPYLVKPDERTKDIRYTGFPWILVD